MTAPHWVRLTRRAGTLSAYTSTDGVQWSFVDTDAVGLGETVYVGMAVSSHEPSVRASATFSAVTVSKVGGPTGETSADVGAPAITGSVVRSGGTYTITAAGRDIWDTADQFHYVYQSVTGDIDVRARVGSLRNTDGWAKAGVMIRESAASDSRHAFAAVTPENGFVLQQRSDPGGWSDSLSGGWGAAPGWMRLTRNGNIFEAFRSSDGASWTSMGRIAVPMASTVLVGLAVSSHNEGAATVAAFDDFELTAATAPANAAPVVAVTAPATGTAVIAGTEVTVSATASDADGSVSRVEFYANGALIGAAASAPYSVRYQTQLAGTYSLTAVATDERGAATPSSPVVLTVTAAVTLPAGQVSASVGAPALTGSVLQSGGTYTITAAGRDIWDTADQFHYVYQQVTGDVDVRARVASLRLTDGWAKAGVMIRETLAPGSQHALAAVTPENGYVLQHRSAPDAWSDSMSGGSGTTPVWVRLTRLGTRFEAFRSNDGVNWSTMGATTVQMGSTVLVGLAVTSHNEGSATVAVVDNLKVSVVAPDPTEPSPTEPPPSNPTTLRAIAFTVSPDHNTLVGTYVLEVHAAGATPTTTAPVAHLDLGKPVPNTSGEATVDCSAFFQALDVGNYQASVVAVGASGSARSAPVSFTR